MTDQIAFNDHKYWERYASDWHIRPDTIYLNHGSFGPSPYPVRNKRRQWIDELDQEPMDFYVRKLEGYLASAKERLGQFVGARPEDLIFVENSTYGINVVAESFPLASGDEVLLNNHEYGAVHRIWERACVRQSAKSVSVKLPERIESRQQVIDALLVGVTKNTKLLVVSHITSPTALIMPVAEICRAFSELDIPVCIDGPHAPAHVSLDIERLECAYYAASCHKWLCAPLGSGFLYVHPDFQDRVQPPIKSWGRLLPAMPERWDEEFTWMGTRDPSTYLAIPAAIDFLTDVGLDNFRGRSRWLAAYAEQKLRDAFGTVPIADRDQGWYGSMAHVPLPEGDWSELQVRLWERLGIEVPIIYFEEKWFVRVSCHLYNTVQQIDALVVTLQTLTGRASEVSNKPRLSRT